MVDVRKSKEASVAPAEKTKQEMRSEKQGGPDHMEPCVTGSQVTDSLCICGRPHRWLQSAEKNKQGARAEDPRLVKTSNGPRGQKRRGHGQEGHRSHWTEKTHSYLPIKFSNSAGVAFFGSLPPGSSLSSETSSSSKMMQEPKCVFRQG